MTADSPATRNASPGHVDGALEVAEEGAARDRAALERLPIPTHGGPT